MQIKIWCQKVTHLLECLYEKYWEDQILASKWNNYRCIIGGKMESSGTFQIVRFALPRREPRKYYGIFFLRYSPWESCRVFGEKTQKSMEVTLWLQPTRSFKFSDFLACTSFYKFTNYSLGLLFCFFSYLGTSFHGSFNSSKLWFSVYTCLSLSLGAVVFPWALVSIMKRRKAFDFFSLFRFLLVRTE